MLRMLGKGALVERRWVVSCGLGRVRESPVVRASRNQQGRLISADADKKAEEGKGVARCRGKELFLVLFFSAKYILSCHIYINILSLLC